MRASPAALYEAELGRGLVIARKRILRALADPGIMDLCRARFHKGAAEHGDDWLDWPGRRFDSEFACEVADSVNYSTMKLVVCNGQEGEPC